MPKHRDKPKKTNAKAQREQDQPIVDRWFGTENAGTVTTGWEPEKEEEKK